MSEIVAHGLPQSPGWLAARWPGCLAAAFITDGPQTRLLAVMVYGILLTLLAVLLIRESRRTAQRNRERDVAILADRILQRIRNVTGDVALGLGHYASQIDAASRELSSASAAESPAVQQRVLSLLQQMVDANRQLQEKLKVAEFEIAVQRDQVEKHASEARTDQLTSLPNRRAFDEACDRSLNLWQRYGHQFSVALIDVDHFKRFNDRFGHQSGDAVLREVGECLQVGRSGDFVCRYGGEEFALLLANVALPEALPPAERMRKMIGLRTIAIDGQPQRVTVSVGVATAMPQEDVASLLGRADQALYAAKQAGRDCTFFHDGSSCRRLSGEDHYGMGYDESRLILRSQISANRNHSSVVPLTESQITSGIVELEDVCQELRKQLEANLSVKSASLSKGSAV